MEDPPPPKSPEKKQKKKKKPKKTTNGENKPKEASQKNFHRKIYRRKVKKATENDKDNQIISLADNTSDSFDFDKIASNKNVSALISDLVNCYTHNCGLPQNELDNLNRTLYKKTVSVLSFILNNCVEKIYNKVLKSDYFVGLKGKKVETKDAECQTDISYEN